MSQVHITVTSNELLLVVSLTKHFPFNWI